MLRGARARRGALVLVLALVLIPFGVPRVLDHARAPSASGAGASFATVCRDHGGTPATSSGPAQRACFVHYGQRVYRMDAITARGFDQDAARFQRQGCTEARQGERGETFVFHPATGVCERRP